MRELKLVGIVLQTKDVGERDALFVCLTRDHGVVRAWVRGHQLLHSRLRPNLQPGQHASFRFVVPTEGLPKLVGAAAFSSARALFENLPAARAWQSLVWLVTRLGAEGQSNPSAYEAVAQFLQSLQSASLPTLPMLYLSTLHRLACAYGLSLTFPESLESDWVFSAADGGFLLSGSKSPVSQDLKSLVLWLNGNGRKPEVVSASAARQLVRCYADQVRYHYGMPTPELAWF